LGWYVDDNSDSCSCKATYRREGFGRRLGAEQRNNLQDSGILGDGLGGVGREEEDQLLLQRLVVAPIGPHQGGGEGGERGQEPGRDLELDADQVGWDSHVGPREDLAKDCRTGRSDSTLRAGEPMILKPDDVSGEVDMRT
jgi:hypothetical protein